MGEVLDIHQGDKFYRAQASLGRSASVSWDGIGKAAGTVRVVVPGDALAALGWAGQLTLLSMLDMAGMRVTRIDPYVDDWGRTVRPEVVRAAMWAGKRVSRMRGAGKLLEDAWGHQTVYLGSRASDCMIRWYEKAGPYERPFDRGGRGPVRRVRIEPELKGAAAKLYVDTLLANPAAGAAVMWGVVRGHVDFVDRPEGAPHGARYPLLDWWDALVRGAHRSVGVVRGPARHVVERLQYAERHLARLMASVWIWRGDVGFSHVLADGLRRLTPLDRAGLGLPPLGTG